MYPSLFFECVYQLRNMNSSTIIIIIVLGTIIAVPVTRVVVNQIGKFLSASKKPYLYLLFAILPVWEMWGLFSSGMDVIRVPFFYFWLIYLIAIVILFFMNYNRVRRLTKIKEIHRDGFSS